MSTSIKPVTRIDQFHDACRDLRGLADDIDAYGSFLHDLAYERDRAGHAEKVGGGTRDYALDTNGDPRARGALKQLFADISRLRKLGVEARDGAANASIAHDSIHEDNPRDPSADVTRPELVTALASKAKRGEAQHPDQLRAKAIELDVILSELETLRSCVLKIGRHPDQSNLTVKQKAAWDRARGIGGKRRGKRGRIKT